MNLRLGTIEIDVDVSDVVDRLTTNQRRAILDKLSEEDPGYEAPALRRALEEAHEQLLRHQVGGAIATIEAAILDRTPIIVSGVLARPQGVA